MSAVPRREDGRLVAASLGSASRLLALYRLPRITIEMSGDARCLALYRLFTKRHPRYRLIRNKAWGVALLRLPDTIEGYMGGGARRHMRGHVARSVKAGYTFARVEPLARLDEIMAINRSAEARQGKPMHPDYLDANMVTAYLGQASEVYAVVDKDGRLAAYGDLRVCGDVASMSRLLGHADHLQNGVMYRLMAGIIEDLIGRRAAAGAPSWFMYDTFPGASAGMAQFKRAIGCEPYRVSWRWVDPADAVAA
ncbi:MAG TPA: hypothetical protein VEI48_00945 [Candidatus Sulfotelmatobacter sp.]|nr:hypothetical protein [Candidatus Sulfotelmatobacter sp.]